MATITKQTITFKANDGTEFPVSFNVEDGKTAFEVWKEYTNQPNATEEDFKAFQKGEGGRIIVSADVKEETVTP